MIVLLIEDNEVEIELALIAFRRVRPDEQVIVATDGQRALDTLATLQPALILLDLSLPSVDGWTVLRWIRDSERLRMVPVVIFSGAATQERVRDAYTLGANSYVVKPSDYLQYEEMIQKTATYWIECNYCQE